MKTRSYRNRWTWSRVASSPLIFLVLVIVLGGVVWASGLIESCWFGIDCPPSTEGLVAIPISAKAIAAYTKLSRDHAWNAKRGRLAVVWLPPEQVTASMKTDLKDILGRVLARDTAPGYVFTDADFLPKGSRPGLVGGIPPGKRAVRVEAGKVNGLYGLNTGDRFDRRRRVFRHRRTLCRSSVGFFARPAEQRQGRGRRGSAGRPRRRCFAIGAG